MVFWVAIDDGSFYKDELAAIGRRWILKSVFKWPCLILAMMSLYGPGFFP